jgi:small conductance mechanosensitive channel
VQHLRAWHLLTPLRIVVILAVAWLAARLARLVVGRFVRGLAAAQERLSSRADAGRSEQRRRTLTTVLGSTLAASIWLIAVVTVIGEAGINLGAFVATATIIGGALAFGAQTLVRDLIAGLFVIAEDQFGVGDFVDLGAATGTVEKVSLRTTRLRDGEGRVWYVPNGQINRVANLSQGHATAVADVSVSLSSDLDVVGARLVELAMSLRNDADIGPLIMETPELVGVESIDHERATLRLSITTRPGSQFRVRRALLAAVAAATRRGELPGLSVGVDPSGEGPGAPGDAGS